MTEIRKILRKYLTPSQYKAATDSNDTILTLACAGSGKSRTLAFRIARLVAEEQSPSSIVAFTFTEKAAEAIKLQVARALQSAGLEPTALGAMFIGTIHSYCQNVLGEIDSRYRQFDVLDENRLVLYLMSRYAELGLKELRTSNYETRYFKLLDEIKNAWLMLNDELLEVEQLAPHDPLLASKLRSLKESLHNDGYIDFSSMIRLAVDGLRDNLPAAERAISRVRHLMVDEYQDVNPAQEALISEIQKRSDTLFVVGDDDQAIYAWRGADVSNILNFKERYQTSTQHTLSKNFRSTPLIVDSAEAFAAAELGAMRISKKPTADETTEAKEFRRLWFDTREEEAGWVAQTIEALLNTRYLERDGKVRGLTPSDFAILMRSTRSEEQTGNPRHHAFTRALSRALNGKGVPYTLEAGGGIFDRPQVKVVRAAFELLRTNSPSREDVREFFDNEVTQAFPTATFNECAKVFGSWGVLIHGPVDDTRRRVYPQLLLHELLKAFGFKEAEFDSATMQDLGILSRIIQDVETVYLSIDSSARFADVLNFLSNVAERGYDSSTQEVLLRPNAVTVSTVHRMKGLEFPVVFVVDVASQRFPKRRSTYRGLLPGELVGQSLDRGAYQSTPEEEARLFYTAVTRAERFLFITGAAQVPGGKRKKKESRFAQRLDRPEILREPSQDLEKGPTVKARRRIDETIMPTSYSDVKYYLRCPKDYHFRKSLGFSPPITEMFGFGQTVHAAIGKLHEVFLESPPSTNEAAQISDNVFHLKHVPQSKDPENHPGPYERAAKSARTILEAYAAEYSSDFISQKQVEVRFEIPVKQAVITGSIDLMIRQDAEGDIVEAEVIDFKAVEGGDIPEESERLHWTELSLQVQLYAKAASEVLGENARTGSVHLLKDGKRIEVPINDQAVAAAVENVEWAVDRILDEDFPMRPGNTKCQDCDFSILCPRIRQDFKTSSLPSKIHLPGNLPTRRARAFSDVQSKE